MPETDSNNFSFTLEEWLTCLKVLDLLKDNPSHNPNNLVFKTLISKIKKNARKRERKDSYREKKETDLQRTKQTQISKQALNNQSVYEEGSKENAQRFTKLEIPKNCYACNESYQLTHFFYNRLCPKCATINYSKRFSKIDLTGRNIIVTGGRVKIGFATALKLLKSGANVTVTSRFPAIAYNNFKKQEDSEEWIHRLSCYGLDLRNLKAVDRFVNFYKKENDYLDILINNAAQTIRYPEEYYLPIMGEETKLLQLENKVETVFPNTTPLSKDINALPNGGMGLQQLDKTRFNQPIDSRDKTSWNSTLVEISLTELLEVNLINQIAPYQLIKELKCWMEKSPFKEQFIINVTFSEGQFSYNNKTIFHPHTNMTKAALNMMTRTSSKEFSNAGIYMNSVDVGWVSTGAIESLRKKQFEKGYIPPLDPVDGAARIIDPILQGINGERIFGKLLKNYEIVDW